MVPGSWTNLVFLDGTLFGAAVAFLFFEVEIEAIFNLNLERKLPGYGKE